MDLWNGIPIFDDTTKIEDAIPAGEQTGTVARDYSVQPAEMFAPPSQIVPFTQSEIEARVKEQAEQESSLMHLYLRKLKAGEFKWLLQGQSNYCWAHSVTHGIMLKRMAANLPYVPLSAFSVAAVIMKGGNKGGWAALAADHCRTVGVNSQAVWPQGDFNYQRYQSAEARADAAKHRVTEDFADVALQAWDQNLTRAQILTQLVLNNPVPSDRMRWSHSTCGLAVVQVEPGRLGIVDLNSWPDGADRRQKDGLIVMTGDWLNIDGAIAITSTTPS